MSQQSPFNQPYNSFPPGQHPNPHHPYFPANPYGYPPPLRHSTLGLASLVLGLVALFTLVISVAVVGYLVTQNPELLENREAFQDPNWIQNDADGSMMKLAMGGLGMCCSLLLVGLGFLLGILGLVVGPSKKLLAYLGIALNGLIIVAFVILWIAGRFA